MAAVVATPWSLVKTDAGPSLVLNYGRRLQEIGLRTPMSLVTDFAATHVALALLILVKLLHLVSFFSKHLVELFSSLLAVLFVLVNEDGSQDELVEPFEVVSASCLSLLSINNIFVSFCVLVR